jgi:hypothetical protein
VSGHKLNIIPCDNYELSHNSMMLVNIKNEFPTEIEMTVGIPHTVQQSTKVL